MFVFARSVVAEGQGSVKTFRLIDGEPVGCLHGRVARGVGSLMRPVSNTATLSLSCSSSQLYRSNMDSIILDDHRGGGWARKAQLTCCGPLAKPYSRDASPTEGPERHDACKDQEYPLQYSCILKLSASESLLRRRLRALRRLRMSNRSRIPNWSGFVVAGCATLS
jgi:hypothetical protein